MKAFFESDGKTLPIGPVVISPDGLFPSLFQEGFRKESLTYRGQTLYSLLTDVAEGLSGSPSNWFKFSLEGKLQIDVGLGCLMLPIIPSAPVNFSTVDTCLGGDCLSWVSSPFFDLDQVHVCMVLTSFESSSF